jgi:hypothetical protein
VTGLVDGQLVVITEERIEGDRGTRQSAIRASAPHDRISDVSMPLGVPPSPSSLLPPVPPPAVIASHRHRPARAPAAWSSAPADGTPEARRGLASRRAA